MDISVDKIIGADEILVNTQKINNELSERSELIVFDNNKPQFVILSLTKYEELTNTTSVSEQSNNTEIKIGRLVQDSIAKLIERRLLSVEEIERLCTLEYSNRTFGLNFPMLKEFDPNPAVSIDVQKRDKKGYNRYYKYPMPIYEKKYLLCSQWVEGLHRKKFLDWLSKWN